MVRVEVLAGSQDDAQYKRIKQFLSLYLPLEMTTRDWEALELIAYTIKHRGVTVSLADAMLAALALQHNLPLWTEDADFQHIVRVYPSLRLYQPARP